MGALPEVVLKRELRSWLFDALVAIFLVALSLSLLASVVGREPSRNVGVAVALLVAHSGCLLWRRKAPLGVMLVALSTGLAVHLLGYPVVVLGVAIMVALYTVASRCDRRPSLAVLGATIGAMAIVLAIGPERADLSTIVGNAIVFVVVWFLGDSQRARRAYVDQLEERTAQLEQAHDELANRAVAEERLRIARELHDVVAHSMGVIAVQAGVGAHVIDSRPDEARRSLEAIEEASKSALVEIRRMLGLLRGRDDTVSMEPSPRLDDLPRLAEDVRRAGLEVELRIDPEPGSVPLGIQLTIYRLVQEALTNVMKHAAATRTRVTVRFADGAAHVEVVDDGVSVSPVNAEGHGLAGMRERVAMYGGTFDAGRLPEGGFRVVAEVPGAAGPS